MSPATHSGVLRIARKLYGGIGAAFYGPRTTLVMLFLMALLRIQRPEQLKERDPAALGRLLDRTVPRRSRPSGEDLSGWPLNTVPSSWVRSRVDAGRIAVDRRTQRPCRISRSVRVRPRLASPILSLY